MKGISEPTSALYNTSREGMIPSTIKLGSTSSSTGNNVGYRKNVSSSMLNKNVSLKKSFNRNNIRRSVQNSRSFKRKFNSRNDVENESLFLKPTNLKPQQHCANSKSWCRRYYHEMTPPECNSQYDWIVHPKPVKSTRRTTERTKPGNRAGSSIYYSSTPKWKKVVTWKEATDCRPPMRIDMEGPTPCSYSPRNKPLNETNSPCYTFGSNCFRDKDVKEGARTSWAKTWFQGPEVFNYKADFFTDRKWPTPASYKTVSLIGPRQRTFPSYPAHTIAERGKNYIINKRGSENEPAPWEYDVAKADKLTLKRGSSYSLTPRQRTQLWGPIEKTPGPGEYEPKLSQSKKMFPAFTVNGIRREKSQALGPFSTF